MLKRTTWMVTALMLMAAVVQAQDPQPRRPGGFGGRGGLGGGSVELLGMPEVRKELNTTEDQNKQIDATVSEWREQQRSSFSGFNPQDLQNLSPEERQKKIDELRTKAEAGSKAVDEKIAKILDAKQNERLKQLKVQRQGAAALSTPEVVKALELTQEQQDKIKKIQDESRAGGAQGFGGLQNATPEEREKAIAEFRQRREKVDQDILAVLTDAQKAKFAQIKGAEFKFPQRQPGQRPGGAPGTRTPGAPGAPGQPRPPQ